MTIHQLNGLNDALKSLKPHLLIAPPRSASSALARALSNRSNETTGSCYIHEPCGIYHHKKEQIASIKKSLENTLLRIKGSHEGILIKEMTFQIGAGSVFEVFVKNALKPIIFLIRDPILCIESRIRKICEDFIITDRMDEENIKCLTWAVKNKDYSGIDDVLTDHVFPLHSTGWETLEQQVDFCRRNSIDFVILDATSFRQTPEKFIKKICDLWGTLFEAKMLVWSSGNEIGYGDMSEQNHWYERVAQSKGILPPNEQSINLSKFPKRFREHITESLVIYNSLLEDPRLLK